MEQQVAEALLLSSFLAGIFFNLLIPILLLFKIKQFSAYIAYWKIFEVSEIL